MTSLSIAQTPPLPAWPDGPDDPIHTLHDGEGLVLRISPLGASWLGCEFHGRELLLAHDRRGDPAARQGYLGAVCGRYANRIAGSAFELDGHAHRLAANEGRHCLHGGPEGFHRRHWTVQSAGPRELRLHLHSPDGDQGFPGALDVALAYRIDGPGRVSLHWSLACSAPCPVSLTSHAYFNLDGDGAGIAGQRLCVPADQVLPVDAQGIPAEAPAGVAGTRFDLRGGACPLGPDGAGYDHCFPLAPGTPVTLDSRDGRVRLALRSSLPGLQVYSGRHLPEARDRLGRPYAPFAGLALEPQHWPDAPNRPHWPSHREAVVRPGQLQAHAIHYHFQRR